MRRNHSDDIFGLQPVGRRTTGRQDLGGGAFGNDTFALDGSARDRWLLSYADLLTLLLAFFVVMYSVSAVNEVKLTELAQSLTETFYPDRELLSDEFLNQNVSNITVTNIDPDIPFSFEEPTIEQWMANANINPQAVSVGAQDFALTLPGEVLFNSGMSELTLKGKQILDDVLPIMLEAKGRVRIEGHTDSQPIQTTQYPSNWELSAHRAAAAVRYLELQGFPRTELSAVGMADVLPINSNETFSGRQDNRRVVLHVDVQDWDLMKRYLADSQLSYSELKNGAEVIDSSVPETLEVEDIDPELLEQLLETIEAERS